MNLHFSSSAEKLFFLSELMMSFQLFPVAEGSLDRSLAKSSPNESGVDRLIEDGVSTILDEDETSNTLLGRGCTLVFPYNNVDFSNIPEDDKVALPKLTL